MQIDGGPEKIVFKCLLRETNQSQVLIKPVMQSQKRSQKTQYPKVHCNGTPSFISQHTQMCRKQSRMKNKSLRNIRTNAEIGGLFGHLEVLQDL